MSILCGGKIKEVSDAYVAYVKEFFPTLAEKGIVDAIFREKSEAGGSEDEDNNV